MPHVTSFNEAVARYQKRFGTDSGKLVAIKIEKI
jgi:hypothetical protein